jgi:signal transduction histidine kinase
MKTQVKCPRCNQPVDTQARYCPHCQVDLARAAVLASQALTALKPAKVTGSLTPEVLVPRIGDYLIERGALTRDDLEIALARSRELEAQGEPRLVGQVLLEMGLVERETLDAAITEQILKLHEALRQTNRQLEQRVQARTRELQNALDKLSELNQLKSNFIANVSHELRTPLTHIRGYLDLMIDGSLGDISEDQHLALEVMLRSEGRLEELIEELIQFTLASSEMLMLDLSIVDFSKLVSSAISKTITKAQRKHLALEMELNDPLPQVNADEDKLTWVVMELLDNAVKFTQSGGRVKIAVRQVEQMLYCSVTDTGIGIPKERLPEIFAPFHQLDNSVTRRYGGVGLGLALVKKIMEAHEANIKVQSVEGKGTRFEFSLPIYTG